MNFIIDEEKINQLVVEETRMRSLDRVDLIIRVSREIVINTLKRISLEVIENIEVKVDNNRGRIEEGGRLT